MAKVKNAGSNSKVPKNKKRGSYAKSFNKHTPRPKLGRGQGN
jgi:hypothetical protein